MIDPRAGADNITISELGAIVPQIARMFAESMQADRSAIFVYSEDQQSTIALFRHGYEDEALEAHSWTNPLSPQEIPAEAHVLQTKQPLMRVSPADFEKFPLVNPGQELREGRLTDLTVPLIWNDQVQGTAYFWRADDPASYSHDEIQTAMDIGRLAAMTIVFARQYESERVQRQRLATLLDVASIAASGQRLDDVLQILARAERAATGADVCSLYVFDESGDGILAAYQDGIREEEEQFFIASQRIPVTEVPAEMQVRRTLQSAIVRDVARELSPESEFAHFALRECISEILLIPIIWQSDVVGVMYCWFRRRDERFTRTAIETAEAIAHQAGGVVSRARLEATIQRQADESEALLRIGQAVLSSETLGPVLDEIAAAFRQLIPFDYCYVGMLTSDGRNIRVVREWGTNFKSIHNALIPVDASISGSSVKAGELVTTDRMSEDPRAWKQVPQGRPLQAIAVTPLTYDNRILGVLFIARELAQRFTPREKQLFSLLSQQAAVAVERVQAREKLTRRVERQSFLARVGEILVVSENPDHALQQIAEMACGVIGDGIVIGLAGWQYGAIEWVADSFDDPEDAEVLHRGLHNLELDSLQESMEKVLVLHQEFSLPVSEIWADHPHLLRFAECLGVKHMHVLPLHHQERSPGLMVLLSRSEYSPFRDEEIELGRIVAERIGNALVRQQVKRNHESLLRISEALHGQSDTAALVRTIAVELERILPCDQLIIADFDRDHHMLHTQVFRRNGAEAAGREFFSVDAGICGEALSRRQPIMDNSAHLRASSVYGTRSEQEFYRREGESALVTPLIVENEVIGVVFMNRTGQNRFTSSDFETFLLLAGLASAALDRTTLEQHNRVLYRASTEVLAAVVDAKDPTTLEHSRHVASYSRELATLMELPQDHVERIELAGLLHDIGKLGIPDRVLQKPGRLTDDEFALIKTHPDRGARILSRHPVLQELTPMVRHHHEAYDGRGYPARLSGDEIPIGASIICIADAFDTMTSQRTYQQRRSVDAALEELERRAGTQFHPELVKRFVDRLKADRSIVLTAVHDPQVG